MGGLEVVRCPQNGSASCTSYMLASRTITGHLASYSAGLKDACDNWARVQSLPVQTKVWKNVGHAGACSYVRSLGHAVQHCILLCKAWHISQVTSTNSLAVACKQRLEVAAVTRPRTAWHVMAGCACRLSSLRSIF